MDVGLCIIIRKLMFFDFLASVHIAELRWCTVAALVENTVERSDSAKPGFPCDFANRPGCVDQFIDRRIQPLKVLEK